jgi:hypothetical protein
MATSGDFFMATDTRYHSPATTFRLGSQWDCPSLKASQT